RPMPSHLLQVAKSKWSIRVPPPPFCRAFNFARRRCEAELTKFFCRFRRMPIVTGVCCFQIGGKKEKERLNRKLTGTISLEGMVSTKHLDLVDLQERRRKSQTRMQGRGG